jgi:uncharacterized membrane protein YjjP (DUF1212 family)
MPSPTPSAHPDEPIPKRQAIEFVLRLGRALHEAGTPANRLEDALSAVSTQLGVTASFFSTPTSLLAAFGDEGISQRTCLLRVQPSELNLERLVRIDEIATAVGRAEMSAEDGASALGRIALARPRYGPLTTIGAGAVASAGASVFLGGNLPDLGAAGVVGLVVGAIAYHGYQRRELSRVVEIAGGAIAAVLALIAERTIPGAQSAVITVSGVILLLPGLALTLAMSELATRHLASGSARLVYALMILILIALGVAIGRQVAPLLPPLERIPASPMPGWAGLLALVLVPLAFTIIFKARPRDYIPIAVAGVIGITGAAIGARTIGPDLAAGMGAFLVGAFGNVYARVYRRPSSVPKLPGIVLLVPGSLGFRSLQSFLERDTVAAIDTAFSMIVVAVSLAAGLVVSNVMVPSRKTL